MRRNLTDAERRVWNRLRARELRDLKFRRQVPIGRYIVDFCCFDHKVVIELDGGQHADRVDKDAERTEFLQRSGYRVVRFWNHDVMSDIDAVLLAIDEFIGTPHPLPAGEGIEPVAPVQGTPGSASPPLSPRSAVSRRERARGKGRVRSLRSSPYSSRRDAR
ncbi:MAG: endonuclease domain-containing protein [bacterium]